MKKLMLKRLALFLTVFTVLFSIGAFDIYSLSDIKICVNGQYLQLDVPPVIENGRTLVPVRGVFESINADVEWVPESKKVNVYKNDIVITLKINSNIAYINDNAVRLDVPARIVEGRTLVPVRFISESIGASVGWDDATRTVIINTYDENVEDEDPETQEFVFDGKVSTLIGASLSDVIETFGEPDRIDLSKYGFDWYIYNNNLLKYIQIGIEDDKVVGVFTNSPYYRLNEAIGVGTDGISAEKELGKPLEYIKKGNTYYMMKNSNEQKVFNVNDQYFVTVFFDIFDENKVTSYLLIDCETERALHGYYGKPSEELRISFEREVFDLANTVRARYGLKPFEWDDEIAKVARAHSEDMVLNNYFSHTNLQGESPFDRMKKAGISYSSAGENIAMGQTEAIFAHEGWMNSQGHRLNILGNFERLGVGVYIGNENEITYTQNFYTPMRFNKFFY
ncbi:MAG TPA: copper amine oxidase [Hungateiclostridium thermocellum]|uniref:Copper amine oxidase-like domain-containing protein n=1 Tax=Acetivibrio thermocellus (strain ATCC 27405 / DSM 1237 / JCM 9322 / NBRC 103400 / NCIMB 10682 / NRRL B-4536 / VPI 7372) TaxID=203119 RepID=A3DDI5_ACET2|nr:CAP-associated domain-containing protein [Acetivibrio thermocellus]ABN52014.1 copper amine oxidase-like domain-containing protein [Acetivibrio thermocellus ATCC 27405]HBW26772.1 copper amine oxidase [Acetivibrio thermocellus]